MAFKDQIFNDCVKLGDNWKLTIDFTEDDETTPIDLTGFTVRVQVRTVPTAADPPALDLTSGSGLTVTPASGRVEINASTTGLTARDYVWELELTNPSAEVESPIGGKLKVEQDVVR